MILGRVVALGVLLLVLAAAVVGYRHLAELGAAPVPTPELVAKVDGLLRSLSWDTTSIAIVVGIAIPVVLAATAPIVYALRSGDALTVVISLALTAATWLALLMARSSIDLCAA